MNSVKVAVRVRPMSRSEEDSGAGQSVHVDENKLIMKQGKGSHPHSVAA